MSGISKKNIETIFEKIDENFVSMRYSEKKQVLSELEKKGKTVDGEEGSDFIAIEIAIQEFIIFNIFF